MQRSKTEIMDEKATTKTEVGQVTPATMAHALVTSALVLRLQQEEEFPPQHRHFGAQGTGHVILLPKQAPSNSSVEN